MTDTPDKVERREFLRGILRKLAVAGLAVGGGVLAARGMKSPQQREPDCINQGICRGCSEFRECGLPQAISAKDALNRQ